MSAEAPRLETGHWPAGTSGNPGGFSKEKRAAVARVADLARVHTPAAIQTLANIMLDETATRSTRIAAANALLDRAHGKPPQSVDLSFDDPEVDGVGLSVVEVGRRIAFALQQASHALEQKQHERTTAADAEIVATER